MTFDREFHSAALLLLSPILEHRTADLIDVDAQRIEFDELLKRSQPWSSGERMLVDVALDLYNGLTRAYVLDEEDSSVGRVSLHDIITTLDRRNYELVLEAMAVRRGNR